MVEGMLYAGAAGAVLVCGMLWFLVWLVGKLE